METALVIAQIIALLALAALCVYMIIVLLRVRDVMSRVERDVRDMTSRAIPVLENMEVITTRAKSIAENIDEQVNVVRESITSVKSIADNVVDLERRVQDRLEGPILETVALVSAVFKGVRTFIERVRT